MVEQPFKPGSLAAGYFRDSGGDAQEASVPQQESAFLAWCSQNGIIPGAIFKDQARPGSSVIGRAGFQEMMHHFRSGANEGGLVIWSYSRFARDIDDAQFFRADLRRRGYVLYSLNDEIPDGPMGRLFEAAIDWKNEQFLLDLSRDVKRGLYDLVRTHGAVPGTPPAGFIRQPIEIGTRRDGRKRIAHRWVIDEAQAWKVRQAFAMRAAGETITKIHTELRLYSSLNSYVTFFDNEIYTGRLRFGDLVIDSYCPALIDADIWQAVQLRIQENAAHRNNLSNRHPRRLNSSYLLSGLAHCARCSAPLYGLSAIHYDRYACTRWKRRRDCDFPPVPRKVLEQAVLQQVSEYILTPDVQRAHQALIQDGQAGQVERMEAQQQSIRGELAAVKRRIANIINALAESGKSRSLMEKLANLEADETTLLSRLAEIERQLAAPAEMLSESELVTSIERMKAILESGDPAQVQTVLRGLVKRITVDREGEVVRGEMKYFYPP